MVAPFQENEPMPRSPRVARLAGLLMLAVGLNLSGVFHVGAGLQGLQLRLLRA